MCVHYTRISVDVKLMKKKHFFLKVKSTTGKRDTESLCVQRINRKECMPTIYLPAVRNARVHRNYFCSGVSVKSTTFNDPTVS